MLRPFSPAKGTKNNPQRTHVKTRKGADYRPCRNQLLFRVSRMPFPIEFKAEIYPQFHRYLALLCSRRERTCLVLLHSSIADAAAFAETHV